MKTLNGLRAVVLMSTLLGVSATVSAGLWHDTTHAVGSVVEGTGNAVGSVVRGTGHAVGSVVKGTGHAVGSVVHGTDRGVRHYGTHRHHRNHR